MRKWITLALSGALLVLSAPAQASVPSYVSIIVSSTNGSAFSASGYLSGNNELLAGQTIRAYRGPSPTGPWTLAATTTTNSQGYYVASLQLSKSRYVYTAYPGDAAAGIAHGQSGVLWAVSAPMLGYATALASANYGPMVIVPTGTWKLTWTYMCPAAPSFGHYLYIYDALAPNPAYVYVSYPYNRPSTGSGVVTVTQLGEHKIRVKSICPWSVLVQYAG